MLSKLEKPNLVIVDEWKDRSEHFGQIRYDTFGHVALENNDPRYIEINVEPSELPTVIDDLLELSMFIKDGNLKFSMEIEPELIEIRYFTSTKLLYIEYKWKEV